MRKIFKQIFFSEELIPLFNEDVLESLKSNSTYNSNQPFPHIVIDGLFNPKALERVLIEWPKEEKSFDIHHDGKYSVNKIATNWATAHGYITNQLINQLTQPKFLKVLETLTGISGLIPDPYNFGGCLHATRSGGKLAVHADFNKHPHLRLDRRLNLLLYFNKNWGPENGGELELWDMPMENCVHRILPLFNRTVIFSTTSTSWHGVPNPIKGADDLWRKSLALYYYSNGRPEEGNNIEILEHSTIWQEKSNR